MRSRAHRQRAHHEWKFWTALVLMLTAMSVCISTLNLAVTGIAIPFTPVGSYLGFMALPSLYWPLLALTLLSYVVLTQLVKTWLLRMKWI